MEEIDYTGFVYVWLNQKTNRLYIGSHKGRENDGYVGSGKYFKRAYKQAPEQFVRTILEYVNGSIPELRTREAYWLQAMRGAEDEFYNLTECAGGGNNHQHLSDEERNAIYRKWRAGSDAWLASLDMVQRGVLADKKRSGWERNPGLKEKHSQNTRDRRNAEERERTEEDRQKFSSRCSDAYWSREEQSIINHHLRQSQGVKNWHAQKSPEVEKQRIDRMKATKKAKAARAIRHPVTNVGKQVPGSELSVWLGEGWVLGMPLRGRALASLAPHYQSLSNEEPSSPS